MKRKQAFDMQFILIHLLKVYSINTFLKRSYARKTCSIWLLYSCSLPQSKQGIWWFKDPSEWGFRIGPSQNLHFNAEKRSWNSSNSFLLHESHSQLKWYCALSISCRSWNECLNKIKPITIKSKGLNFRFGTNYFVPYSI